MQKKTKLCHGKFCNTIQSIKNIYIAPNKVIDVEIFMLKMFNYLFKNKTKHHVHVTHLNLLLCNIENTNK